MSKVIPNHVVRVGQTVCISPKEEHACLQHPNDGLSCHTLPMQCFYYTVEGWDRKNLLAQTQGCSPPNKSVKSTAIVTPVPSQHPEDKHQQEKSTEPNEDSYPASPTLDISIENLNRLILEIDPTFKPLQQLTQADSPLQAVPQSNTSVVAKHEHDTSDIKYIEMSPSKTKYQESWQSSRSPSSTPFSVSSPNRGHLFPRGGNLGYNCDAVGNISGSAQHFSPTGRQSPTCIQVSESISIPQRDQKNFASYGSNSSLASSPGILQLRRMAQRCSEASMLSTSPGSDTSYIFGSSSSQSLSNHESDTPLTRSIGSPSSVESLTGSYVTSNSPGSSYPRATCSQKQNSPLTQPYQKGQTHTYTHSLSSVTNSPLPIPIVLINGLPEESVTATQLSRGCSSSFKDKMPKTNSSSFSGVNGLNNSYSDNSGSSTSSLDGYSKEAQTTMKFVMDTSKYWFKPSITRDQAIQLLMDEPPGTFIMRDSTSYPGSFGLALKVFSNKAGEDAGNHIRHFLIESSPKGVHLKGTEEEPYFGSLSAFVYQHTIMPLALPCKLIIPSQAFLSDENPVLGSEAALPLSQKTAVCNLLYLHSVTMETLTGKAAVQKAVSSTFEQEILPTPTIVHFKVTALGITLTDIQRKIFFRRHYPLATISFCDMDPENRKWQKFSKTSRIFGVVSKSPADSENICHLFAEYDAVHPASHVVDFIQKLLLDV
ncbi:tensin-4 isoform X2 [Pantherophis guttatus]|uniref:Tensin-4 isoform X2 n=1 Tax=Pantherophis guttatus TaxID=94885 RepID=A0A6P9BLI1_PANGU|nr:tensin-4 isoform X2 [Pantherophis guttatus]